MRAAKLERFASRCAGRRNARLISDFRPLTSEINLALFAQI
jgi:hypothetical protein